MVTLPLYSEMNIRMLIDNKLEEKRGIPFRVEKTKSVIHILNDDRIVLWNPFTVVARSSYGGP